MKSKLLFAMLGLFLLAGELVSAQTSMTEAPKDWQRAKEYTKEYLDAMPESGYNLKPTPEMRSFAEQMLHIADANYAFISTATGAKGPLGPGEAEKTTDKSKANVTKMVLASYDFVLENIGTLKPEQLKDMIKMFGRFDMTKEAAFEKAFEHQTHHRGQTTVYLRLSGVKPPQEKLF